MNEAELVNEIESAYQKREPTKMLPVRVHRSMLLVSVIRALARLYVSATVLIGGSLLALLGRREKNRDPDRRG